MMPEKTAKDLPLPPSWLLQSAIIFRRRKNLAVFYKTDLVVITPKNLFLLNCAVHEMKIKLPSTGP